MEFENQPEIKVEVDPASIKMEMETEVKTEFDMPLTNAIQILLHNSEELILPNCLSSPKHEIEPEVDPLATDSEQFTPDPLEIVTSSSDQTEEQEERKRAKKTKVKTPDSGRSSSFSFIDNPPLQNFDGEKKRNQNSNKNNDDKKNSSCSKATSSQTSVKDAGLQSPSLPFTCFECLEKFPTKHVLKSHIDESHSKVIRNIMKPITKRKLKKNQKTGANSVPILAPTFECRANGCSQVLLSPQGLEQHTKIHKKGPGVYFTCTLCPETFPVYRLLKEHMILHVNVTKFKCHRCSLHAKSIKGLENHLRAHDQYEKGTKKRELKKNIPAAEATAVFSADPWSGPGPRFKCDICVQSYLREGSLADHIKKRSEDAPINCSKCPEQFCTLLSWTTHFKSTHGPNPFDCALPGCFESFQVFHQLKAHMKVHEREKKLQCSVESCGQIFSGVYNLVIHQEMHHTNNIYREQMYQCPGPGCSRSFGLKASLYIHMAQKHSKEQSPAQVQELFPCPVPTCGKIFISTHWRKEHIKRKHDGIKETYKCTECNTSFKYALELLLHFEVHHEEGQEEGDKMEPVSEPQGNAIVNDEMEEEMDVKPKIKLEAGVDSKVETLCEFPTDQVQGERQEDCGIMTKNALVKVEDMKVEPDVHFFVG